MIKKVLSSKRGEMYIEALITCLLIIAFMVFALSVFRVTSTKNAMDNVADQLIEIATLNGCFGAEFDAKVAELEETYSHLDLKVTTSAEKWFNRQYERVQLGDSMTVRVDFSVSIGGGLVDFVAIELNSVRTGASENYWK